MADREHSIQFLIDLVREDKGSHSMQVAAIEGLGLAGGPDARAFLIEVVESGGSHAQQVAAAKALGRACRN